MNEDRGEGNRNIKLIVSYDGTGYSGWQRQNGAKQTPANSGPAIHGRASMPCRPADFAEQSPACQASGILAGASMPQLAAEFAKQTPANSGPAIPGGASMPRGGRTIQGEIEAALAKLHKHPVVLTGSGRTDSGVHAAGQTANFYTDIKTMEARRFIPALNGILPGGIRILDSREVSPGFHARFDAKSRLYRYFFICGREALPPERPYNLVLRRPPDITLLNSYARLFRGEKDCSFFAASGDASRSKNRYIHNAVFFMEGGKLVFEIRANAFLWKMVRLLAGTMLFYGERKASPEDFCRIAASGRRELAGPALPPQGLFLWKVQY